MVIYDLKISYSSLDRMPYPVLVTYSNNGYWDFARNLLLNLNGTLKHHRICFYCLDDDIYRNIKTLDLPNLQLELVKFNKNINSGMQNYGSFEYNRITQTKVDVLRDALQRFQFIHFIDCDIVCVKEPAEEYYEQYSEYDIVFQYDCGFHSRDKPHWPHFHYWTCTGNTTLRNTPGTLRILQRIEEYQQKYRNKNDQECLQQYFLDNKLTDIRNCNEAKLFVYPCEEFTNGWWINHNIGDLSKTYFFHANHVIGGENKKNLLKKAGKWYL
jgi:hypothetical protein